MKFVACLLTFFLWVAPVAPVWAVITLDKVSDEFTIDSTSPPYTRNFGGTGNPTTGSTIFVFGILYATALGANVSSVTDDAANSYTVSQPTVSHNERPFIACASGVTTPTSITINGTATYALYAAISVLGEAGCSNDESTDSADPGPQAADASVTTAGNIDQTDEIAIAVAAISNQGDCNLNITTPSGFTAVAVEQDFCLHASGWAGYDITLTSGAALSISWSHDDVVDSTTEDGWHAFVRTYKGTVAAATQGPFRRRHW